MRNKFKIGSIIKWHESHLYLKQLGSITQSMNDTGIILCDGQIKGDVFFTSLKRVHQEFSVINKFYIKKYES